MGIEELLAGMFAGQPQAAPVAPEDLPPEVANANASVSPDMVQPGMPPPGGGIMQTLGVSPDRMRGLLASLGGGLAAVKSSPFAMESFAHGAGGALQGGEKFNNTQDVLKLQTLDRAQKAKAENNLNSYRNRSLDEQTANRRGALDIAQQNADSLTGLRTAQQNRPSAWNKPDRQVEIDYENAVAKKVKELQQKHGIAQPGLLPEERKKRAEAAAAELEAFSTDLRGRLKLPPAGAGGAPAGAPTPGKAVTPQQYNSLPPGTLYQHPNDPPGQMRRKGGAAAAPAGVPDAAVDETAEDEL